MANKLTVRTIDTLPLPKARREVPDGLVNGLYLVVQPSGAKSWAVRYRAADGRPRKYTIPGTYPAIDLKSARELAQSALVDVAKGGDPAAAKKAARAGAQAPSDRDLVETVVDQFIERYAKANQKAETAAENKRILDREVVGRWRGRHLAAIGRADVHELLDSIVDRGSPVMANRVLAAFRKLCNWSVDSGLTAASPCFGVKPPTAESSRDRVLSDAELSAIWRAADVVGYPAGPMVKLLVLTGQRRSEVSDLVWPEIDVGGAMWTLPAARAKNGNEHTIPLCRQALDVFATLPRIGERAGFAFTTTTRTPVSGFGRFKEQLDRAITADLGKSLPHWTFHDLRRTCATGLARLGVALPAIERTLNHTSGSFAGIVGTYQKHSYSDEKRHALDAWGGFVERLVSGQGDNVVTLKTAG